jgi:HlyD family secretion protein
MTRKIIIGVGILLAALAVIIIIKSLNKKKASTVAVEVTSGDFLVVVTTTGELQAENSEKIQAPSGLRVIGIWNVKITDLIPEGSVVDSGEYVATLDRTEATTRLKSVESELDKYQSQFTKTRLDTTMDLRAARDELINLRYAMEEKQITLEQSKFEPPAVIRQANIELEKAKRAYDQAMKNYQLKSSKAKANMAEVSASLNQENLRRENLVKVLDQFVIRAPKPGMVIYEKEWGGGKRKVGSTISSWDLTVATLPDLTTMVSKTYVNEIDISKIKLGQEVEIAVDAFPGKKYRGKVKEIANVGEQLPNSDAKVFEVVIKIDERDTILRPAMTTSNSIVTQTYKDVLSIPMEAVFSNDTMSYVFKTDGLKKIRQIVWLGESNENKIIVKKGLVKGDRILLTQPENPDKLKLSGVEILAEIKADMAKQAPKKDINVQKKPASGKPINVSFK